LEKVAVNWQNKQDKEMEEKTSRKEWFVCEHLSQGEI
jgi:hypothetical protein